MFPGGDGFFGMVAGELGISEHGVGVGRARGRAYRALRVSQRLLRFNLNSFQTQHAVGQARGGVAAQARVPNMEQLIGAEGSGRTVGDF
jgi:hypothetical protein